MKGKKLLLHTHTHNIYLLVNSRGIDIHPNIERVKHLNGVVGQLRACAHAIVQAIGVRENSYCKTSIAKATESDELSSCPTGKQTMG